MKASVYFRLAAVLIALFAVAHTIGFRETDSRWGLDSTLIEMKTLRFTTQGFDRSYWDFFVGFGLFVTVFLFFAAFVTWQLASLTRPMLASLRPLAWGLTACFGMVAFLSWRYFFMAALVFSLLIFACLVAGTVTSRAI